MISSKLKILKAQEKTDENKEKSEKLRTNLVICQVELTTWRDKAQSLMAEAQEEKRLAKTQKMVSASKGEEMRRLYH